MTRQPSFALAQELRYCEQRHMFQPTIKENVGRQVIMFNKLAKGLYVTFHFIHYRISTNEVLLTTDNITARNVCFSSFFERYLNAYKTKLILTASVSFPRLELFLTFSHFHYPFFIVLDYGSPCLRFRTIYCLYSDYEKHICMKKVHMLHFTLK